MLQDTPTATIPPPPIKKHKRKLPKRSIVDADLVSSKATDSARIMDDLLLPSEHDRIILSEIFDANNDKEPVHASLLPRVVLGVPNKRKPSHLLRTVNHKTYKERLNTCANNGDDLDLSRHVIIPPSSTTAASATTISKKPTHTQQATKQEEKENTRTDADMENYASNSVATTTAPGDKTTTPNVINVKDDSSVLDERHELMAENDMDKTSTSPQSVPEATKKNVQQLTEALDEKTMDSISQIENDKTSTRDSMELNEEDVLQSVDNKDMSAETDVQDVLLPTDNMSAEDMDTLKVEDEDTSVLQSGTEAVIDNEMELDKTGNDLQHDPTLVRISDHDGDHATLLRPSEDSSTEAVIPIKSRGDDTHYEQECYVEIKSYALEYMDTLDDSKETSLPDIVPEKLELSLNTQHPTAAAINIAAAAVKEVDEKIGSPPLQLSQALINTPAVIQNKNDDEEEEDEDEDEEKNWMRMDTDNEEEEESVSEKIFNLMAVKLPVAIPMEEATATNNKYQQHVRLARLKSIQALDWIQNADITNKVPIMVDKKSRQIALKRKQRLAIKRQRPYVIRKRIKSIIWTENV